MRDGHGGILGQQWNKESGREIVSEIPMTGKDEIILKGAPDACPLLAGGIQILKASRTRQECKNVSP